MCGLSWGPQGWGWGEVGRPHRTPCCVPSEDYTEDLLQLHDLEIGRLRAYYDSHRELFDGVKKWEETWQAFQDLEVQCCVSSEFRGLCMVVTYEHTRGKKPM